MLGQVHRRVQRRPRDRRWTCLRRGPQSLVERRAAANAWCVRLHLMSAETRVGCFFDEPSMIS